MDEGGAGDGIDRRATPAVPREPRRVVVQRPVEFAALLVTDEDDRQWLEGVEGAPLPELQPGEQLRVLTTEPNDATYAVLGRVVEARPDRVAVELQSERERIQQRDLVRVATPETPLRLTDVRGEMTGDILNISAGGIRAMAQRPLQVGQRVACSFALPTQDRPLAVDLEAEVVWAGPDREGKAMLGLRFLDVDDGLQAQIAAWVLRQQARGHL